MNTTYRGQRGRRLWHMFAGSSFLSALFVPLNTILTILPMVTGAFLAFDLARLRFPGINRWRLFNWITLKEKEYRGINSATYFLFSSFLAFFFFAKDIAITSVLFLALAEPLSSAFRERRGSRKLWGRKLGASLAFFPACLVVGMLSSLVLSITPILVILGALAGSFIMLCPVDDNLSVPVFAAWIMALAS